jgi:hypothetical protein
MKTEEDEAFEELAKKQGDWGMQGSRKHQILRYVQDQKYNLNQISEPSTISFYKGINQSWVMRITAEGRIEVAEGADVTEAARLVLDAMQSMLDARIKKAVLAEREACAKLCEAQDEYGWQQYADAIRARGQA